MASLWLPILPVGSFFGGAADFPPTWRLLHPQAGKQGNCEAVQRQLQTQQNKTKTKLQHPLGSFSIPGLGNRGQDRWSRAKSIANTKPKIHLCVSREGQWYNTNHHRHKHTLTMKNTSTHIRWEQKVALREYIEGRLGEDIRHIGTLRNSNKQSNIQTRTLTSRWKKVVG